MNRAAFFLFLTILFQNFFQKYCFAEELLSSSQKYEYLDRVENVYLLFASEKGFAEQSFGHIFFRLSLGAEPNLYEDYAVELAADFSKEGSLNMLRGAGIGENYPLKLNFAKYHPLDEKKNQIEDRDLKHYKLLLSGRQKKKLIDIFKGYIDGVYDSDYNFFFNNCASAAAVILENVYDIDIGPIDSKLPKRLPKILLKKNLAVKVETQKRITYLLKQYLEKSRDDFWLDPNDALLVNLEGQLSSSSLSERFLGYMKLYYLANNKKYPDDWRERMRSLGLSLAANENLKLRVDLSALFKGSYAGKLTLIPLVGETGNGIELPSPFKNNQHRRNELLGLLDLKGEGSSTYLYAHYLRNSKHFLIKEKINGLKFDRERRHFKFGDQVFAVRNSMNSFGGKVFKPHTQIRYEILKRRGRVYVLPYLLIEAPSVGTENTPLVAEDVLAINQRNSDSSYICYGLVWMQKFLKERAIFAPEMELVSREELRRRFKKVLFGNIALFPGVASIQQLTSIGGEGLLGKDFLVKMASENQYYYTNPVALLGDYFSSRRLAKYTTKDLLNMLDIGVMVPIIFKANFEINLRHSNLVFGYKDLGEKYELYTYDPYLGNRSTGSSRKMFLRKSDFKVSTPKGDWVEATIPKFDAYQDYYILQKRAEESREFLVELLKRNDGVLNPKDFSF